MNRREVMNLIIISASQREQSQSAKVAQYITETASGYEKIVHIELCKYQLPLWDGEQHSKQSPNSDWSNINDQVRQTDALILITPEWSGMASPLLKNFLLKKIQPWKNYFLKILLKSILS